MTGLMMVGRMECCWHGCSETCAVDVLVQQEPVMTTDGELRQALVWDTIQIDPADYRRGWVHDGDMEVTCPRHVETLQDLQEIEDES